MSKPGSFACACGIVSRLVANRRLTLFLETETMAVETAQAVSVVCLCRTRLRMWRLIRDI